MTSSVSAPLAAGFGGGVLSDVELLAGDARELQPRTLRWLCDELDRG